MFTFLHQHSTDITESIITDSESDRNQQIKNQYEPALSENDIQRTEQQKDYNPKNWNKSRKWAVTSLVSLSAFIAPVSSTMVAPSLTAIATDLSMANWVEIQLILSIFILGYVVGPLILGPLSEIYGRAPILHMSISFYLIWNTCCGFAQNKQQLLIFRFLSGFGAGAPLAVGPGIMSDIWRPEERGKSLGMYNFVPLLGNAIGPIAGGFITQNVSWRWPFHITSAFAAALILLGLLVLPETYLPVLQKRGSKKQGKPVNDKGLGTTLGRALWRPFQLLATETIIQFLAVYLAYLWGITYLVFSTFAVLWTDVYQESIGISSLNYISLGLGLWLGTLLSAFINDHSYRKLKERNGDIGKPEFRVVGIIIGSLLVPIGLFLYGWSAQSHVSWIAPDTGTCVFGIGIDIMLSSVQAYIIDSYPSITASASAATNVVKCLAGFSFPLFAPSLYAALGYGWGNTILGLVAIVIGWPAPFALWKFGEKIRTKSQFCN